MRTHYCGEVNERLVGRERHGRRLGASPPRPRRRDLRRPARPRGPAAGRLRPGRRGTSSPRPSGCAASSCVQRAPARCARGPPAPPTRNLASGKVELLARAHRGAEPLRAAAVPARRARERGGAAASYRYIDLRREEMQRAAAPAPRDDARDARLPRRPRLRRHRDADADQGDARGRARLPGAEPHAPGQVLRAAAVAADLQAAADDGGLRPLLPDRALLPRRGPARRPPARVHAARHRDLVPRRRTRSWR